MEMLIIDYNTGKEIMYLPQVKDARVTLKVICKEKEYYFDLSKEEIKQFINLLIYNKNEDENKRDKIAKVIVSNKNQYDILFLEYMYNKIDDILESFTGNITCDKLINLIKCEPLPYYKELLDDFICSPMVDSLIYYKEKQNSFMPTLYEAILVNNNKEQFGENKREYAHFIFRCNDLFLKIMIKLYYEDKISLDYFKYLCDFISYINEIKRYKIHEFVKSGDDEKNQDIFKCMFEKNLSNLTFEIFSIEKTIKYFKTLIMNNKDSYSSTSQIILTFINSYLGRVEKKEYQIDNFINEYIRNEYIIKKEEAVIGFKDFLNIILKQYLKFNNIFKDKEVLDSLNEMNFFNINIEDLHAKRCVYMNIFTKHLLEFNPLERYKIIKKYKLYWVFNENLINDVINPQYFIQRVLLLLKEVKFCEDPDFKEAIKKFLGTYKLDIKK